MSEEMDHMESLLYDILGAIYSDDRSEFSRLLVDNIDFIREQPADGEFMIEVLRLLLQSCEDEDEQDATVVFVDFLKSMCQSDSKKQLIAAVLEGNLDKARFLLNCGMSIKNEKVWPIRILSAVGRFVQTENLKEMLHLLIEHGLDINFREADGINIFHFLGQGGQGAAALAQELFDLGLTEVDQECLEEHTPLDLALLNGNFKLVEFFLRKGTNFSHARTIYNAFDLGNESIVDLLLSKGANVNAQDKNSGQTALHSACSYGDPYLIGRLLKNGADVDVQDKLGRTPIIMLNPDDVVDFDECLTKILKKIFKSTVISETNAKFIRENSVVRDLYQKFTEEIIEMKTKVFYAPYSYHSVLEMSNRLRKLSKLTKNKNFVAAFEAQVGQFTHFSEDLKSIFSDAVKVRDESLVVKSHIKTLFGNFFPELVVDKIAVSLNVQDLKFE